MQDEDYLNLIAGGETARVEFKERPSGKIPHKICAEIAAFATSGGGTLFIGVTDAGDILGLSDEDVNNLPSRLENWIAEKLSPQPIWSSRFIQLNGVAVLLVVVGSGTEPIYYYDGRPYHRVGTSSRIADASEVKNYFLEWSIRADMVSLVHGSAVSAIYGQGELATTSYRSLVERLCSDFPVLVGSRS